MMSVPAIGALNGEISLPSEWREAGGRFGVGDYVTRDGTDVHRVVRLYGPGSDAGEFVCVVAPADGWATVGEIEHNMTRRYDPVDYSPPDTVLVVDLS